MCERASGSKQTMCSEEGHTVLNASINNERFNHAAECSVLCIGVSQSQCKTLSDCFTSEKKKCSFVLPTGSKELQASLIAQ